jgi:hypothetical protein
MKISSAEKKSLIESAKDAITNQFNKKKSGISSAFIKINKKWGVKFTHRTREYMADTYKRQRRGWRLDIAPYCFGFTKFEIRNNIYYGYITEIVDVVSDKIGMFYTDIVDSYYSNNKLSLSDEMLHVINSIKGIVEIIRNKLNFDFWDYHAQNLGLIGDKVVVIDWGDERVCP